MALSQKPLVVVFLGSIGSGKSFFARQLAQASGTVRINTDAMREAMGEVWSEQSNRRVWGAMDYSVEQILSAGQSVIYDAARFNRAESRELLAQLAEKTGAKVIVVWIDTPREVASLRAQTRELTDDQRPVSKQDAEDIIDNHEKKFDPPEGHENVIKISGEIPFEEQYKIFTEKLTQL